MATNLIEALAEWIDATPWFAANFSGVHNSQVPNSTGAVLPYLTFVQTDSRASSFITGAVRKALVYPVLAFEVRAATGAMARSLGEQARDQILAGTPLSWTGGLECGRFPTDGEGGELEEGLGIDGTDVWVHRVPITFITARG